MRRRSALLPGINHERAVEQYVNSELTTYHRWAIGQIAVDELRIGFLAMLLPITTGPLRSDIARRYAALCARRAGWVASA